MHENPFYHMLKVFNVKTSESLWYNENLIRFKRSVIMSVFYHVRGDGEWLGGLRGQVNNSEVNCLGLLVQLSGLKAQILYCVLMS